MSAKKNIAAWDEFVQAVTDKTLPPMYAMRVYTYALVKQTHQAKPHKRKRA